MEQKKVAVIMGSDSDFPTVKKAVAELKALGIPYEAHVLSAHRTPDGAIAFAKQAKAAGFGVILAAAGMAVATVAIDGAKNAAILAAEILALGDENLAARLQQARVEMAEEIAKKDAALQEKLNDI